MARASNKFEGGEVILMDQILSGLLRGHVDPEWALDPHFPQVARRFASMKRRIIDLNQGAEENEDVSQEADV